MTRTMQRITLLGLGCTLLIAQPSLSSAADAAAGQAAWIAEHPQSDGSPARQCATCHGTDLRQAGRHINTGKVIEPMAPSVNPTRLSDPKKIEKWLGRNCRWTLGRDCTADEKANFLAYISSQ